MLENISILKNKINNFINNNPDLNCVDLSLLKGIKENKVYMVNVAIAAGANVYLELEAGDNLLDLVVNYSEDQDIVKLFMNVLLEDASKKNDHDNILFAISNGADTKILENSDFAGDNVELSGNYNDEIEF